MALVQFAAPPVCDPPPIQPVGTVLPETLFIGDDWQFTLTAINTSLGDDVAADLTGCTAYADLFQSQSGSPIFLQGTNGSAVIVGSPTAGQITVTVSGYPNGPTVSCVPSAAGFYPTRVHVYCLDALGHRTTIGVVLIPTRRP